MDSPTNDQRDLFDYQDELVRKGLEEMRMGRTLAHEEVVNRLRANGKLCQINSNSQ